MKNLLAIMGSCLLAFASVPNLIDLTYENMSNKSKISFLNENTLLTDIDASVSLEGQEKVEKTGLNEDQDFDHTFRTSEDIKIQTKTGQPFSNYWSGNGKTNNINKVKSILDWSAKTDIDAKYNRSAVSLQDRKTVYEKTNKRQMEKEVQNIMIAVANEHTSGTVSQGFQGRFDNWNQGFWQYIDFLVSWAGSADEGIIVPPSADIIDAAHQSGTKVLGTIFLDAFHGLTKTMIDDFFVQDANGNYKMADKLIEIANYFGFDGWMMNGETLSVGQYVGPNNKTFNVTLNEIAMQYQEKKLTSLNPNLVWISYKNSGSVTEQMDMIQNIKENKKVADYFVQDFGIPTDNIEKEMNKVNRSKYQIAGMEYDIGGSLNSSNIGAVDFGRIIRGEKSAKGSLATFAGHDTYLNWARNNTGLSSNDPNYQLKVNELYLKYDNELFTGTNKNPSLLNTNFGNGISEVIQERSVINSNKFSTNFSTGQGMNYFVNGETYSTQPWNHRGLQDILPTYRWIIQNDYSQSKTNFKADFDYTDGYYGGNNLMFSGNIDKNDQLSTVLYGTRVKPNNKIYTFSLYNKMLDDDNKATKKLDLKFKITYIDKNDQKIVRVLDDNVVLSNDITGWNQTISTLKTNDVKEIIAIGLQFDAQQSFENAKFKLGRLSMYDNDSKDSYNPNQQLNLKVENLIINQDDPTKANARIHWNSSANVWRYEIYQVTQGLYHYLGATRNNAFYVKDIDLLTEDKQFVLGIKRVYNSAESDFDSYASFKLFTY